MRGVRHESSRKRIRVPSEIVKAYEPQEIERRWAQAWFEEKLYHPLAEAPGTVFSIALALVKNNASERN